MNYRQNHNRLIGEYDGETIWIEPWGSNALRVRATKNAAINEKNDWALLACQGQAAAIEINDGEKKEGMTASIVNGNIKACMNHLGRLTIYNDQGEVLLKESWRTIADDRPRMALNKEGREFKGLSGNSFQLTCRFDADDSEKIYGMGQYQIPYLDMKGCNLELAQRNSQASIPFMISNKGYGFLWNNPAIGRVVFGKNETEWVSNSTTQCDYLIIAGETPSQILEIYMEITGKPPMMPEYGTGFWQSKLRYKTQDELLEVAREHHRRGLPMSVIVADYFHWTQQGDYKFDPEDWPDPEAMVEELQAMGIELMVSVWPTVDYRSENFDEMMKKGCLVRTERGLRGTMQFIANQVFIDTTNPETQKFVWQKVKENYYSKGIRLFWLDEAEPEYSVYDFDNYRYHIGSNAEVGNIYPYMYAKGFYDGLQAEGEEVLNLVRCAWAGSQRMGALLWSGDIDSTFDSLRRQIRAGLSAGLAGIPWWTSDIGGFHGGNVNDPSFKELLIRWFQFGAFCPVFRLHGVREPRDYNRDMVLRGHGTMGSGAYNEVWRFGEDNYQIMSKYLFMRERLRPYISDCMKEAHEKGTPVMRPLMYDFPDDQRAWEIDDVYMFGHDILVAPVMHEGQVERNVYLPEGGRWTHVWTGDTYDGGVSVTISAPIDQIPLFLRDNAVLPILEQ